MSVYAVSLNQADEAAWETLRKEWPERHFILTDRLAFVAPEGITTTAQISEAVGIGGESNLLGLVLEVSAHSGFNKSDLWEWLRKVQSP